MIEISQAIQDALISNWHRSRQDRSFDPTPVLKLFLPWAPATWLVADMNPLDRDAGGIPVHRISAAEGAKW